jgi:hypothetical protein
MRPPHLFCKKSFLQKPFIKELAEKEQLFHMSHDFTLRPRCEFCPSVQVAGFTKSATFNDLTPTHSLNSALGRGEHGLGRHFVLPPPPTSGNSSFLSHSPWLLDIWGVFWMQIVPLEAAHLFDLNVAILGWPLAAVQPKKQLPRHSVTASKR